MVDRALESSGRVMEEYEAARTPGEPKDSLRARIAQNLKRQIDTVSDRWSMLSHRSEDWQLWIDEVLRVCVSIEWKCLKKNYLVTTLKEDFALI